MLAKLVTVFVFIMAVGFAVALGGTALNWPNYVCDVGLIVFIISMFSLAIVNAYNNHEDNKKKGTK